VTFHRANRPSAASDTISFPTIPPRRHPKSTPEHIITAPATTTIRYILPLSRKSFCCCLSRIRRIRYNTASAPNTIYHTVVKKSLFSTSPAITSPVRCNNKNNRTINIESGKSIRISNALSSRLLCRRETRNKSRLNPQAAIIAVVLLEVIADAKKRKLPSIPNTLPCRFPI